MKSGKATGVCGIPAELLKADGDTVQRKLQLKELEFKRGKGDHREYGGHRGVTPSQRPENCLWASYRTGYEITLLPTRGRNSRVLPLKCQQSTESLVFES